ncbi:hypothetical protein SeMB42_g03853 [Synchytrium endobioticum]|uniref:Uncharacterized protein n=1 Tax=Synchytrium endobioticum TaxID=286115 RepID=A0A507D3A4_9FUNG|nr:hypothetical protein SeLEV6574_g06975 [Synchytrium endobioticum]TPX45956.1 hypothetical protein SeMB42_g03853 [Synchytrium endobioticum]
MFSFLSAKAASFDPDDEAPISEGSTTSSPSQSPRFHQTAELERNTSPSIALQSLHHVKDTLNDTRLQLHNAERERDDSREAYTELLTKFQQLQRKLVPLRKSSLCLDTSSAHKSAPNSPHHRHVLELVDESAANSVVVPQPATRPLERITMLEGDPQLIRSLKNDLLKATVRIGRLERELESRSAQLNNSSKEMAHYNAQMHEAQRSLVETRETSGKLREDLRKLESEYMNLQASHVAIKHEYHGILEQKEKLKKVYDHVVTQRDDVTRQKEELTVSLCKLNDESSKQVEVLSDTVKQRDAIKNQIDPIKKQLHDVTVQNNDLTRLNDTLTMDVEHNKNQIKNMAVQIEHLTHEHQELQSSLQVSQSAYTTLKLAFEKAQLELESKKLDHTTSLQQLTALANQLSQAHNERQGLQTKYENILSEFRDAQQGHLTKSAQFEIDVKSANDRACLLEDTIAKLNVTNACLSRRLDEVVHDRDSLRDAVKALDTTITTLKSQIIQTEETRAQESHTELESELCKIKSVIETEHKKSLGELRKSMLAERDSAHDLFQAELHRLQQARESADAALLVAQSELQNLKDEHELLKKAHISAIESHQAHISELSKKQAPVSSAAQLDTLWSELNKHKLLAEDSKRALKAVKGEYQGRIVILENQLGAARRDLRERDPAPCVVTKIGKMQQSIDPHSEIESLNKIVGSLRCEIEILHARAKNSTLGCNNQDELEQDAEWTEWVASKQDSIHALIRGISCLESGHVGTASSLGKLSRANAHSDDEVDVHATFDWRQVISERDAFIRTCLDKVGQLEESRRRIEMEFAEYTGMVNAHVDSVMGIMRRWWIWSQAMVQYKASVGLLVCGKCQVGGTHSDYYTAMAKSFEESGALARRNQVPFRAKTGRMGWLFR